LTINGERSGRGKKRGWKREDYERDEEEQEGRQR
jgi:hypothetical protein